MLENVDNGFRFIDFGAEQMPIRKHPEDAGHDVFAPETFTVQPHCCVCVDLGFGLVMPAGYQASIIARGSTGLRGLLPVENPIDSNYRGEAHAVVWNVSDKRITIRKGERFCQLVATPCVLGSWPVITREEAPASDRGTGHFGSTGK